MRLLVTGGSGFIGTNLIKSFQNLDKFEIINIDIASPKLKDQFTFWKNIDIRDYNSLKNVIINFKPNIVIHLAAKTDLNGTNIEVYDSNTSGVKNLLKVLDLVEGLERVIFASSMYVCKPGYLPSNWDDYKPHTIYGKSKVLTEKIIKEFNPKYIWTIVRPTSIWGPFFGEPYNLFFKIVLSKKYFHLGKRACNKTYGYIDNFIYQIESILQSQTKNINKKTFYLGDYQPYDITAWANEIAALKNIKIPKIPYSIFKLVAYFGDILKFFSIKFPMTSFRLKNMTTNNVYDMTSTQIIAPNLPVSRLDGTKKTILWLENNNDLKGK
tara:strand:- start:5470 stop:6444 length:975 start_codon:yes stop_codon:yes gene_type:complete